ncbi:MAG TPA: SDR family oxidoreductase [Candidatus Nanoarchaeia archaeon]|nr:SDR family oxidoreductase [Candidatus Nanoarchaeia archaeon]
MTRLEQLTRTTELTGKRIIVTGCGYRPVQHIFYDIVTEEPSHDPLIVDGQEMKLNIGAAAAGVLALQGATVHMVSTSEDKLKNIKQGLITSIDDTLIEYSALNLLDEAEVKTFVKNLHCDKPLYWVQSVGLGAGSYKLKDDNPYLPIEEIPLELIEKESQSVLRPTHLMMQQLLPRFRKQKETRIAIITSMSAIRGYSYGATHCAAKGAIDRYANAAMLGLYNNNIFLTTVRPGAMDTGLYDNPAVQEALKVITDEYRCDYRNNGIRLAPPTSVGEAIKCAFTMPAHIPSLNLVAKGQLPHEGS